MKLRPATPADLPALLAIQNEIIATTNAIYVEEPETLAQRTAWFEARMAAGYPVFVAQDDQRVIGFASYGAFRARSGYRFTVEHSVHLTAGARGRGAGTSLLQALIKHATEANFHTMVGAIDASNTHSIRFHTRFGFTEAGRIREAAHKNGDWLDVVFMQRLL